MAEYYRNAWYAQLQKKVAELEEEIRKAVELPAVTAEDEGKVLIVDSNGNWVADEVSNGHNYSTTEQVVGTWIDGKPLYQITVISTATADIQDEVFNIPNIREVIKIEAVGAQSTSNSTYVPDTFIVNSNYRLSFDVQSITASTITLRLYKAGDYIARYYTLFYTKTTD